MNKAVKILFILVVILGFVSIGITYRNTVVERNYKVIEPTDESE